MTKTQLQSIKTLDKHIKVRGSEYVRLALDKIIKANKTKRVFLKDIF